MYSWTALYEQFDFKDKKCLITVTSIEVQEKKGQPASHPSTCSNDDPAKLAFQ